MAGATWLTLGMVGTRALQFLTLSIIARLLGAADLGVLAICAIFVNLVAVLRDTGLSQAVVHSPHSESECLVAGAVLALAMSLGIGALVASSAPLLATFYSQPALRQLLPLYGMSIVLSSLGSPPAALLEKRLDFRSRVAVDVLASASGATTAIVLAVLGWGAMAVAWSQVAQGAVFAVGGWMAWGRLPQVRALRRACVAELARFGGYVSGTGLLSFTVSNLDYAVAGRLLSAGELGAYSLAYSLANALPATVASLLNRLLFPVFAHGSRQAKVLLLRRALLIALLLGGPFALLLIGFAPTAVRIVYGRGWELAVTPTRVLGAWGLLRVAGSLCGNYLAASGRPQEPLRAGMLNAGTMALVIVPLTLGFRAVGTAWAATLGVGVASLVLLTKCAESTGPHLFAGLRVRLLTLIALLICALLVSRGPLGFSLWVVMSALLAGRVLISQLNFRGYQRVNPRAPRVLLMSRALSEPVGGLREYVSALYADLPLQLKVVRLNDEVRGRKLPILYRNYLASVPLLLRSLRHALFRPDLVVADNIYAAPAALLLSWTLGTPYLVHTYGTEVTSGEYRLLQKLLLRRAHAVVTISRYTSGRLLAGDASLARRIAVVRPGVDLSRFSPGEMTCGARERLGLPNESRILLTVGRIPTDRSKGQDTILSVLPTLIGLGGDLRYVVVGDGPGRDKLMALSRTLGLDGHVVFAGAVADSWLPTYYGACTAFVMPSRPTREGKGERTEGFGIVYLEAAASGRPTVASKGTGAEDAVADGVTGLLVDPEDPEAVRGVIARLLADPRLTESYGRSGRNWALQFEWGKIRSAFGHYLVDVTQRSGNDGRL